jgi:cytoskeletal protein RodZ
VGRRSSPNQWPFYRSVFSWFVPWALVAVIVGIGVWVAVDALSGGAKNSKSSAALVAGSSSSPSKAQASKASPTEAPSPQATSSPKTKPKPKPKSKPSLITGGVTIQVLNGTSAPSAAQQTAVRLARLGFKVVAVSSSVTDYTHTTVFWANPGARPAAKALAAHFGWVAAPKPANLSPQVSVHVVVGADAL